MRDEVLQLLRLQARRCAATRSIEWAGWSATAAALACALVAGAAVWWQPDLTPGVAALWSTAACVAAAAVLAAGVRRIVGVSRWRAGAALDRRCRLQERLATAAELAERNDASPPAQMVYAQAAASLQSPSVRGASFRRAGGRSAAALLLSLLAAAATAGVLAAREDPAQREVAEFLAAMRDASSQARDAVQDAFRQAADHANDPQTAGHLDEAARLVVTRNDQDLAKLVAELRRRGIVLRAVLPEQVRRTLNLGGADHTPTGGAGGSPPENTPGRLTTAPADDTVRVYNPQYLVGATNPAGSSLEGATYLDLPDAWAAAQARAAHVAQSGDLPADLRPIMRRFFQTPPQP